MAEAVLLHRDAAPAPVHVAIIMDGNGRWARARGLPRTAGHKRGAEAVKTAAESAAQLGVQYLTLFGFSSENWKRPLAEVSDLMGLLRYYLQNELDYLRKHGIRLRVIGERERLAPDIVDLIESAERQTAGNCRLTLIIALSYGSRAEIAYASRRNGVFQIAETEVVSLTTRLLTSGPESHEEPTYSPDGRKIVFTLKRGRDSQIYVMDEDGSNWRQLTNEGTNFSPNWSPYP